MARRADSSTQTGIGELIGGNAALDATIGNVGTGDNGGSDGGIGSVSPDRIGVFADGEPGTSAEQPKRRGRKPGSTAKPKTPSANSVGGIETILFSMHNILAKATKIETLALDKDECKALAEGITNVSRHYNTVIDPKVTDWCMLIVALGTIYVPRLAIIASSKRKEKPAKVAEKQNAPEPAQQNQIVPGIDGFELPTIGNPDMYQQ